MTQGQLLSYALAILIASNTFITIKPTAKTPQKTRKTVGHGLTTLIFPKIAIKADSAITTQKIAGAQKILNTRYKL